MKDIDPTLAARLTAWRRHLHAYPELSKEEAETAAFVAARLDELGVPHVRNIGGHGIVATIARGGSNRAVGLRADMDALAIEEATGLPYASVNPGVMHACGHDGHTASLLGAAALLAADPDWRGTVHLVFQPAEEGAGGARAMLADGLLERFPMDRIFAFHNWPGLEAGTIMLHDGPVMAAGGRIAIRLEGHAGHAALPHLARDPMLAAAHLLVALQSIVSRNVDPLASAVVTIGIIEGGTAANQIPRAAMMRGTYRSYRADVHEEIEAAIQRIATGVAAALGVEVEVAVTPTVAPTVNDQAAASLAASAAEEAGLRLRRDLPPSMAGEDFCWFLQRVPGAFAWIGNGPAEGGRELHNPGYDFNDTILPAASTFLAATARRALASLGP